MGLSSQLGVTSPDYRVFSIRDQGDCKDYYLKVLEMCYLEKIFFPFGQGASQVGRWRFPYNSFRDFIFPYPPKDEQEKIAKFINRKNTIIESTIEIMENFILLLEDKRSALITQVVTKGLDPDVIMKDSGINWIGEIPEHWTVKRVKHIFKTHNGATPNSGNLNFWGGEINWITPEDLGSLKGIEIGETSRKITPEGYISCGTSIAKAGSIAISTRAPIGHLAITTSDMSCNQGCRLLEPIINTEIKYFHAFLKASVKELQSLGRGSTFKELPRYRLENLPVLLPPPKEIAEMSDFLEKKTVEIDLAVQSLKTKINLLKEYRTALISAAVTGKIDLRGL